MSLSPEKLSAGPRTQSRGNEIGLPEILLLIDLHGAANSFLQSIRSLPVLSNTRAVDAREKRLETDYTKAMACLQEHSLDHQAAYVNAVHFRQALPEAVGARVLELAY